MNITKEQFQELAEELHNNEVPFELFQICHEALEEFNNGKGTFYNRLQANLPEELQEKFNVMAGLVVADQLPLYSKEQAIDSRIHDLNQLDNPQSNNPALTKIDLPTLIDDEINEGKLLRLYKDSKIAFIPDYLPDLHYCLQNMEEGSFIGSEEMMEIQPYITALLGEDDFNDLTIREQELVARQFKQNTVNYSQVDLGVFYSDPENFSNLNKYITWDRTKVAEDLSEFVHYHQENNPPKFRDIYVHKGELNTVVEYCEHKLQSESKKVFPDFNFEAIDIAKQISSNLQAKKEPISSTLKQ